ncbi:hypothetical protein MTR67_033234 [Solanum verrucosum]|uniref:Uncharacterized protein n=1 Tax=Solanum verrucosum TaxID=315347 RepID=A0AAF0U653_SOLVR|nr:hypothetical protein MTR67_033234 [Solanum verrucosum]
MECLIAYSLLRRHCLDCFHLLWLLKQHNDHPENSLKPFLYGCLCFPHSESNTIRTLGTGSAIREALLTYWSSHEKYKTILYCNQHCLQFSFEIVDGAYISDNFDLHGNNKAKFLNHDEEFDENEADS